MKSAVLFVILFVSVTCSVFPQNVPQLVGKLETANSDSSKIDTYFELATHYQFSYMDSALHFAREGLNYAREKHYVAGEAVMTYLIGQILERHGILEQAKEQYEAARQLYKRAGNDRGVASVTNGLGVIAGRTGKYEEATRYFLEALALYENLNYTQGIVQSYIKLGVVNDHLGDLDKALQYYLKAEDINAGAASSNATLTLLNNIGIIYGRRGEYRTALTYFQRGIRQSDPSQHINAHIALLGSLGIAYQRIGMQDSAWHYQQQALSMARLNQLPEEEARSLVNLAALVADPDPDQSLRLLNQALDIAKRIHQLVLITEIYESMIDIHKGQNEFRMAMELAEKRQQLKDSLFSIEKAREIANLQATQELARQENEIRHLALQNEKSKVQRNIMLGIAMLSIGVIIIVWFYNKRVSNLNTQLIRKQIELKNSNDNKDKLLSILGHDLRAPLNRVIGLLDLLSMQQKGSDESGIIEKLRQQSQGTLETLDNLLMWGQNQLKGIKLNQQTLHAKEQISRCIVLSSEYASQKNVKLVIDVADDVYVYADPSHFHFVIRNLVSNAIKFSHAGGTVRLSATSYSDEVIFSIADSGVGIPKHLQLRIFSAENESAKGTWNEKGTGIGLMLCREYVAENGGKLWVESKEGEGSTFYFSLRRQVVQAPASPSFRQMA